MTVTAAEQTSDGTTPVKPPAVPEPQSVRADIEYVVLRLDYFGDGSAEREHTAWTEVARTPAKTPADAITATIGNDDPGETGWVAVAARYWSPVTFDVNVVRTLIPKAAKS